MSDTGKFDIICVTNRKLCREDLAARIEKVAAAHPSGILLREKDMTQEEYRELARQALALCREYGVPCILHSFADVAKEVGASALHMPLPLLREMDGRQRTAFALLGASCHSAAEAKEAERLGCTYITAGHVFDTDCKKGLPGRGIAFLREVCRSVSIPVYAIGGIGPDNIGLARQAGADGACIMSGLMRCGDPGDYLRKCGHRGT